MRPLPLHEELRTKIEALMAHHERPTDEQIRDWIVDHPQAACFAALWDINLCLLSMESK